MSLSAGIVGLPNVGKSTVFNALTSGRAAAENYPFCTVDPNHGVVAVPDDRLDRITAHSPTAKVVPTVLEIVDIAGLVRNASKGEGLGNQFLGHIRAVDAILHVVRCFEEPDVVHVEGTVDPVRDAGIVETEHLLKDLETLDHALDKAGKAAKSGREQDKEALAFLRSLRDGIGAGRPARSLVNTPEEIGNMRDLNLLTLKPMLYVANVDEGSARAGNRYGEALKAHAEAHRAPVIALSGKIEAEIAQLSPGERADFLAELGLSEPGLAALTRALYSLLGLQTFFTVNENENHAWAIPRVLTAPQAAGRVHSDFEKGFIKAEVYRLEDLERHGSLAGVRTAGKMRLEGHDYVVEDGDIMYFKFNV